MSLVQREIGTKTGLLTLAVILLFIFGITGNAYAVGIVSAVPSSVPQGASFQVSGTGYATFSPGPVYVDVFANAGCGTIVLHQAVSVPVSGNFGPLTLSSTSLTVGVHCIGVDISGALDFDGFSSVTVTPPVPSSGSSYVPVAVGGRILAANQIQIILPWVTLIALLAIISVWTLIIKPQQTSETRQPKRHNHSHQP